MVALSRYIDRNFIERVTALSVGESRTGAAVAQALNGAGTGEARMLRTFRAGAQFYSKALSGVNFAASLVNFAQSDLDQLKSIADRLIEITEVATKESTSKQERNDINQEYFSLGRRFNTILEGAKVGDKEYLSRKGLQDVLVGIGLDPKESNGTRRTLDQFHGIDESGDFANPDIKGNDTQPPTGAGLPRQAHDTDELFTGGRGIANRADAYAILDDLHALSDQIDTNLEALDGTRELLLENALLVRSMAFTMLDLTEQLNSEVDATEAAKLLREAIVKNARQSLAQAENLEPMIVASLTLEDQGIVVESG